MDDPIIAEKYDPLFLHEFQVHGALDLFMQYIDFLKDGPLPEK